MTSRAAIGLLMLASGFAGLGYQIIWTQQAALWLGHESAAVLAVVTAFFAGLALGAGSLGRRIERSRQPGRWYAGCEALIALWAAALTVLMTRATGLLSEGVGLQPSAAWQWTVGFVGCTLLLLPATAAMGATVPAMARCLQPDAPGSRRGIAGLYAANTLGAVVGVLAIAFWGVPELGLLHATALCAAINLACALLAWRVLGGPDGAGPAARATEAVAGPAAERRPLAWLLAATGFLGLAYEVTVVRVLSQVAEDTVYTFALLLAVYLVGTAAGAAWLARRPQRPPGAGTTARLLHALAWACLLGGASLWAAEWLRDAAAAALARLLPAATGAAGLLPALGAEAALAVAAFALPTAVMGALFSHLAARAAASGLGLGLGRALAVNTLGAALAPVVVGAGLLPAAGAKATLAGLVAAYALLAWGAQRVRQAAAAIDRPAPLTARSGPRWEPAAPGLTVGLVGLLALAAPPLVFVSVPPGGRLVDYREGALAAVSVTEDSQGVRRLHINNRQQEGSSHTLLADGRQALLPLLLHPAPRRVLFLGLGTGLTASAAAQVPGLAVEAVELLPEVVAASALFQEAWADPAAAAALRTAVADARRHMRQASTPYDLIVADNVHPARSGTGSLYTVEHFQAVRARLAAGGLFCQWLPLHQMDRETLASIVAAFRHVWPGGRALLATHGLDTPTIGLLGHADDAAVFDLSAVRARLGAAAGWPVPPAAFGLHDEWAVLGSVVAGPAALAAIAGKAPPNSDDRPIVAYRAPRSTYAPEAPPRARLLALLQAAWVAPGELLGPGQPGPEARLAAYRRARDQFLAAGRHVRPVPDAQLMLDQIGQPLLRVLHTSPDFRPAYDPLLAMARALSADRPAAARPWLHALARVQPARPEAAQALAALDTPGAGQASR